MSHPNPRNPAPVVPASVDPVAVDPAPVDPAPVDPAPAHSPAPTAPTTIPALRRQVVVACDLATAQRLWRDEIGLWWPVASFGCFGEGATVAFEGDQIVETSLSGERAMWGTVTDDSPGVLAFTWHPGSSASQATAVRVEFTPTSQDGTTLVTLIHSGWHTIAARERYANGWPTVLGHLADARPAPRTQGPLWFLLEHTAGPATPETGVFSSPLFDRHLAFLGTLKARGVLVAAGPLPDTAGGGLTVVRVDDHDHAAAVVAAAQDEDGSVAGGLLEVRVRPWQVALSTLD